MKDQRPYVREKKVTVIVIAMTYEEMYKILDKKKGI